MRTAVLDGAKGIGPDDDVTQLAQVDQTSVTTVFAGEPGASPVVVPREPRAPRRPAPPARDPYATSATQAPPARRGRRAAEPPPRAQRPRRRRGVFRRLFTTLLLLVVLIGAAAAAYLATSPGSQSVRLRNVVHGKADQVVRDLTQLINDNTR
jgi:serine/threonine-protein kinase